MIQLPDRKQIEKQIVVVDWWALSTGLEINYDYKGKNMTLMANPEQAAQLFKNSGLIADFCGAGDEVAVEFETIFDSVDYNGNHIQELQYPKLYWPNFVRNFQFSQSDALCIVIDYEFEKELRSAYLQVEQNAKEKIIKKIKS